MHCKNKHPLSEASLGIVGDQLRAPLETLNTIVLCDGSRGFKEWVVHMILPRGGCKTSMRLQKSDRRGFCNLAAVDTQLCKRQLRRRRCVGLHNKQSSRLPNITYWLSERLAFLGIMGAQLRTPSNMIMLCDVRSVSIRHT